mmetsp:Transcript_57242/g.112694  ORF Transcript_57242/g.112694 Transcript_57242/m.112694 type:complete len:238 (+) Transcript_57242:870-1583(+)
MTPGLPRRTGSSAGRSALRKHTSVRPYEFRLAPHDQAPHRSSVSQVFPHISAEVTCSTLFRAVCVEKSISTSVFVHRAIILASKVWPCVFFPDEAFRGKDVDDESPSGTVVEVVVPVGVVDVVDIVEDDVEELDVDVVVAVAVADVVEEDVLVVVVGVVVDVEGASSEAIAVLTSPCSCPPDSSESSLGSQTRADTAPACGTLDGFAVSKRLQVAALDSTGCDPWLAGDQVHARHSR